MKRLWLAILMQLVAHDVGQLPEEHEEFQAKSRAYYAQMERDDEDSTRRRKQ